MKSVTRGVSRNALAPPCSDVYVLYNVSPQFEWSTEYRSGNELMM